MNAEELLSRSGGVLYIHPHNHVSLDSIAAGTVAAINSLPGRALGRYAEEVSPEEVAVAKVVLMDVHYIFPLGILEGLLAALRRINPRARVVLGGITAAFMLRKSWSGSVWTTWLAGTPGSRCQYLWNTSFPDGNRPR